MLTKYVNLLKADDEKTGEKILVTKDWRENISHVIKIVGYAGKDKEAVSKVFSQFSFSLPLM